MKKTYIEPKMDVVYILSQCHMLSGSNEIPSGSSVNNVRLNPESMSGGDGGGAAGREVIDTPSAWEEW